MSTLVSRWATRLPRCETSGRSSVARSATDEKRTGTIWVMTSSAVRLGSGSSPTIVGTARSRAPSIRTILLRFPLFTAVNPWTSRMASITPKTSSCGMRPDVCTVTLPRTSGAST